MPVKYRPANGPEWQAFDAEWCARCEVSRTCPIPDEAARRRTTDALYPAAWAFRNGSPVCTAFVRPVPNRQLDTRPPARCPECGHPHQPEEPHALTEAYRLHFAAEHGRAPTWADAIAHTQGLIRAASEAAYEQGLVS